MNQQEQKQHAGIASNIGFRLMALTMSLEDKLHPHIDKRVQTFGIKQGMTVVDYGCGPARYTIPFARLAGPRGTVYAVDVHPLAIEAAGEKAAKAVLTNITPVLAQGYHSGLPDHVADMVCALDMFFAIPEPTALLAELKRIAKPNGILIIDDGHAPRSSTLSKIRQSGQWTIVAESKDHLTCTPT